MTIASGQRWSIAVALLCGAVAAGQMTPASISQIQQPGQQNQAAQQPGQQPGPPKNPNLDPPALPDASKGNASDDPFASAHTRAARAREDERQKRLVSDTEKLLALATQLHNDVVKTNKDIMSLDVIKRADEIEKLAHNVKLSMKD